MKIPCYFSFMSFMILLDFRLLYLSIFLSFPGIFHVTSSGSALSTVQLFVRTTTSATAMSSKRLGSAGGGRQVVVLHHPAGSRWIAGALETRNGLRWR